MQVTALIEEGDDAVEPLLKCLEDDTRLTRSVHFWRDFAAYRSLLRVHEAAYVALSGILQTSFFGVASTGDDLSGRGMEGRRATAAAVRAYWKKFKGVRPGGNAYIQPLRTTRLPRRNGFRRPATSCSRWTLPLPQAACSAVG